MKEEMPLVSILVLCYNHEHFVQDCLRSLLNQDYRPYEILICDDASKDGSVAAIQQMKENFEKEKIEFKLQINEKNCGITKNLNSLLRHASGEYVKIISSDDMLSADYLSNMVPVLQADKSLQFVFSNGYKVYEEAGYPIEKEYEIEPLFSQKPDCNENILERIYVHNFIPAPAILFRKSILEEVGGYDETIGIEDLEMLLRILKDYPNGVGCVDKKLVYYRINSNSITSWQKNDGAWKRVQFMHRNCVAIAKKYRKSVSKRAYRNRMIELYLSYLSKYKKIKLER